MDNNPTQRFRDRLYFVRSAHDETIHNIIKKDRWIEMVNTLDRLAEKGDWDTVKDIISTVLETLPYPDTNQDTPALTLDHLYSLIPGQGYTETHVINN